MELRNYNFSISNWAINFGLFNLVGFFAGIFQISTQIVIPTFVGILFLLTYLRFLKKNKSDFFSELIVQILSVFTFLYLPGFYHESPDTATALSFVTEENTSIEKFAYFSTIWGSSFYLIAIGYGSKFFLLLWRFFQLYTFFYWLLFGISIALKETKWSSILTISLFLAYVLSPMYLRHLFGFQTNHMAAQILMCLLVLVNSDQQIFGYKVYSKKILIGALLTIFCYIRIDTLILILPLFLYIYAKDRCDTFINITFFTLSVIINLLFIKGQNVLGFLTNTHNINVFYVLRFIAPFLTLLILLFGKKLIIYSKNKINFINTLSLKKQYWIIVLILVFALLSLNINRSDGLYNFLYNTFSYKSIRRSWGVYYYGIFLMATFEVSLKKSVSMESWLALIIFVLSLILSGGRRIGEGDSLNRMMLTVGVAFVYPFLKQHKLC
jgi:hypothetical protein